MIIKFTDNKIIISYKNSDKLYILSCRYNFQQQHCSSCKPGEQKGIVVMHGSGHLFDFSTNQPVFPAIYAMFSQVRNVIYRLIQK